jgi:hypothetical protein
VSSKHYCGEHPLTISYGYYFQGLLLRGQEFVSPDLQFWQFEALFLKLTE